VLDNKFRNTVPINNDNSTTEKMNKLCEGIMYLNCLITCNLRWFDKIVSRIQNATPTTPTTPTNQIPEKILLTFITPDGQITL